MSNSFSKKHLLSVDDLTKESVSLILQEAAAMQELVLTKGSSDALKGKIVAAIFYEPSTRTFTSFITAAQRLGAGFIPMQGMHASSVAKGETLEDTIRTVGCSADLIVLRHPEIGSVAKAAEYSYVPLINAGDGTDEHPTQALLDVYTIQKHFASLENTTVGMVGDMLNGRTVHSLSKLLATLGVKKFIWIAPEKLKMPQEIYDMVARNGANIVQAEDLASVIQDLDVLYVTRVQKERFTDQKMYEDLKHKYIITPEIMKQAKKEMILLHPLPRVGEIDIAVDLDPRAVYMKEQMQNGVYIRMALLKLILS